MKKGIFFIFGLLLISQVSAFAVSSAYYEGNPLKMKPGDTVDFIMFLQNTGSSEIEIKAQISSGSEVIKITDSDNLYSVSPGGKTTIHFTATTPEIAKAGEIYPVSIEFATLNEQTGGFGFGTAIGQSFEVAITNDDGTLPQPINYALIAFLTIGISALAFGIFVSQKIKKRKKSRDNFKY